MAVLHVEKNTVAQRRLRRLVIEVDEDAVDGLGLRGFVLGEESGQLLLHGRPETGWNLGGL